MEENPYQAPERPTNLESPHPTNLITRMLVFSVVMLAAFAALALIIAILLRG